MLQYNRKLKDKSRLLRRNQTESEKKLWSRLRGKQLQGIQFYRQKPIGNYIVDFFAPMVKLVIEIDGSQHRQEDSLLRDENRDAYLKNLGLKVMRFNSRVVLMDINAVVEVIYREVTERMKIKIPLNSPLKKREIIRSSLS